jgi:hypothetical protein
MADRPIIFSAPMVRALLEGRKTQTRRIIKPQPELNEAGLWVWPPYGAKISKRTWRGFCQSDEDGLKLFFDAPGKVQEALPAKVGDRLWVRESHSILPKTAYALRKAVDPGDPDMAAYYREGFDRSGKLIWRPSIHMPRWASRMTLAVTEVRVQRLQEISEADAKAEGVRRKFYPEGNEVVERSFVQSFAHLWNTIHGVDSWEANRWVAAISFSVEQQNIDAVTK